jgi:hypothetical protein
MAAGLCGPDATTMGLDPIVVLDAILGTPENLSYWIDDLLAFAASHGPHAGKGEEAGISPADLHERVAALANLRARALLRNALGDLDGAVEVLERLADAIRLLDAATQSGIADRGRGGRRRPRRRRRPRIVKTEDSA